MTEQELRKLQVGDLILLKNGGEVGYVCGFGKRENGRWIKSPRKECDGVRVWIPRFGGKFYEFGTFIRKLLLTKQEVQMLGLKLCWLRMPERGEE